MAIAYVNGNSGGNSSGTDVTVTKPTGVADGDILIAVTYREGGAWTLPSGWAWVDTGTPETKCNISAAWIGLAWKRAASEGASYVFQLSASAWRVVTVGAWSGCATSGNPFDVYSRDTTAATTATAPSITTTVANTMLVVGVACFSGNDLSAGSSGMTQRAELGGCELFEEAQATAGASGTQALSGDAWSGGWVAWHAALLPASGAPAPLSVIVGPGVQDRYGVRVI